MSASAAGIGQPPHAGPNTVLAIAAASAGNALEFFDFTVYGYFAPQIAAAFFPGSEVTASLLTWGTYATSFLARPLGALAIGSYADRHGRRAAMTLSILLMTVGTLAMAVMPFYRAVGLAAPFGILAARLLQGFSAGGEFGGATAYMLEAAGNRRGLIASFQYTSQIVSSMLGSGLAWLVAVLLSPHALGLWGFRIPFVFGLLICPLGLYLRSRIPESAVFEASVRHAAPALSVMLTQSGRVLLGAGTIAAGTAGTYLAIYLPSYAQHDLHMKASSALAVPALGSFVSLVANPLAAYWSDRTNRLRPALLFCPLLMLSAYPAFRLITAYPSFAVLAVCSAVLIGFRSAYSSVTAALLGELFPPSLRGVGMSISYSTGVLVFGSATGLVNDWIVHVLGYKAFPGLYLTLCSAVTLACLLIIRARVRLEPL